MSIKNIIISSLQEQYRCVEKLENEYDIISRITDLLIQTREKNNKIFVMGNGGSSSTASHFVADLLKTSITHGNKRFFAMSLTDNIPVLLAWSNDVSYESIFVEQLKNFLSKDDVVIGFSGSGKSRNVLNAFNYAKECKAHCVGFTGMSGGGFPNICEYYLVVPSNDMLIIESTHIMLCHTIISTIRSLGKPEFTYQ